jgi:hypothetical protein
MGLCNHGFLRAMGPWGHGQSGNKFLEDLEGYNEQVDQLSECGNLRQVDEHLGAAENGP